MSILKLDYNLLWNNIRRWSRSAGRSAARPVLLLWYVMRSPYTPRKDKLAIFTSIAYLVLPVNILKGARLPVIGWIDEVVSIAVTVQKMSKYVTPDICAHANRVLDRWFPGEKDSVTGIGGPASDPLLDSWFPELTEPD